jgi:hypothetical protein
VALIAMASLLIFCCVRSRRRSRAAQIDLIGGGGEDVEYKPYPMAPTGGLYDQTHQYSEEQYVQPYTHANATGSTGSKVELPVASQTSAAPAPSPTTATRNPVWGDLTVEVSFQRDVCVGLIDTIPNEGADDADDADDADVCFRI